MRKIEIYDTTLRDGAQQQGVNFSVENKIAISCLLRDFGIESIEGGWPGAIPKDTEFFEKTEIPLVAFGSTAKPEVSAKDDSQLQDLISSQINNKNSAKTVTIVAKTDPRHVENALKTTLEENLEMIERSVKEIVSKGLRAIVDAEHFFDGFLFDENNASENQTRARQPYCLSAVLKAFQSGADTVVLCDTNGGQLPSGIERIVKRTTQFLKENSVEISPSAENGAKILGIHAHNDTGCAVANSIVAVENGVAHVQGTVNEYGERTGNANLLTVIGNLETKLSIQCVPDLSKSFNLAHNIAEIANINCPSRQPYVGDVAFAHKAGLHASAIKVNANLYQHIDPKLVGNDMKMIVSEMAGRSSIELKSQEMGHSLSPQVIDELTQKVKNLEQMGYAFDSADASFELLLLDVLDKKPRFFAVESWRAISERLGPRGFEATSEATVKIVGGGNRIIQTGEGNGPVNALDAALRLAIGGIYPEIDDFELTDYRVRLLDTAHGTDSVTRVLITCYDAKENKSWTTIGVGANIVEASWEALTDCYIFGLISREISPR